MRWMSLAATVLPSKPGGVYLGHEDYEPLWAELDRRKAVVFVHPTSRQCSEAVSLGRPRPMLEFVFDSTRAVSRSCARRGPHSVPVH